MCVRRRLVHCALLALAVVAAPAGAAPLVCPPAPRPACKAPMRDVGSKLDVSTGARARVRLKWRHGEATAANDLGLSTGTTSYRLCVYDHHSAQPQLVFTAAAPGGGTCDGKPCWRAINAGFRYSNPGAGADTLAKVTLKTGVDGRAQVTAEARGSAAAIGLPLGDDPLVTAVLLNDAQPSTCWVADLTTARHNDVDRFSASAAAGTANRYGVDVGGFTILQALTHDLVLQQAADTLGSWVRLQVHIDGTANPNATSYPDVIAQGQNVLLTVVYRDPANVQYAAELGTYPNAGFPYTATPTGRQTFKDAVKALVATAGGSALAGRQVWFQCENEVGDRAFGSSVFWRGTASDYLAQMQAFYEAVKEVNPSAPVVLSSMSSDVLGTVIGPDGAAKSYQTTRLEAQLATPSYDAADLHFYHCESAIQPKIDWLVKPDPLTGVARLPSDRSWISTENGGPDDVADSAQCSVPASYDGACGAFECEQAAEVPARLTACHTGGSALSLWFSLRDFQNEVPRFQNLGLVDQGAPDRYRKAFCAFRRLADPAALPYAACATSCSATCP